MQYLRNAGYMKYDFWTSGNNLGTDMFLWMSTGLPFNATFDYMIKPVENGSLDVPPGTEPQRVARERFVPKLMNINTFIYLCIFHIYLKTCCQYIRGSFLKRM